jgi:hypothetical protein
MGTSVAGRSANSSISSGSPALRRARLSVAAHYVLGIAEV